MARRGRDLAQVDAAHLDPPGLGIGEPGDELHERGLPAAGLARRSRRAPRPRCRARSRAGPAHLPGTGTRRPRRGPESAPAGSSTPGMGSTISTGRSLTARTFRQPGDRGLRLAVDLREIGEHVQERVREEQERRHPAERETPLRPEPGAERHDDRDGQRVEDRGQGEERGRPPVRDDLRPVAPVDRAADPAERLLVQAVGAHHARPPSRTRRPRRASRRRASGRSRRPPRAGPGATRRSGSAGSPGRRSRA